MTLKPPFPLRLMLAFALVAAAVVAAVPGPSAAEDASSPDAAWARRVCKAVPRDELQRTYNGYRFDRSGDIQFFAKPPDFVGSGLPHVGPWDYVQGVPMVWYGPGFIQAGRTLKRPVTLADIAPTQAALLDFPFNAPDGRVMGEALLPEADRPNPPKIIVTVIWDAGGTNVLNEWKRSWPNLRKLAAEGTQYTNATVGLSPPSTAQAHATIGTGAFPNRHALVAHHFRVGETMTVPWEMGSRLLDLPTLSDLYDRANGNKPIIAGVGSVPIHLGMVSHGTTWGGGDKDIAILTNVNNPKTVGAEGPEWSLPEPLQSDYRFPEFALNVPGYSQDKRMIDQMDGKADGKWREESIAALAEGFETPARIPWETTLVQELIKRERLGADATPDLLFVNYKVIDYVSHVWSMNSPYMDDSVRVQDEDLPRLVNGLDSVVGKDEYVLLITADHGAMPDPKVTGAFVASPGKIGNLIEDKFGEGTIMLTQNTTAFLDVPLLESRDYTVADVARYVETFTKGQTYLEGVKVDPKEADDRLFDAAFPSSLLADMPCVKTSE